MSTAHVKSINVLDISTELRLQEDSMIQDSKDVLLLSWKITYLRLVVMSSSNWKRAFGCKTLYFTPRTGFFSIDFSAGWMLVWNTNYPQRIGTLFRYVSLLDFTRQINTSNGDCLKVVQYLSDWCHKNWIKKFSGKAFQVSLLLIGWI